MLNLLRLSFLPKSVDCGLLMLRLGLGLPMLLNHGLDKARHFSTYATKFAFFGMPNELSLGLCLFAELICAGLLIIGLFTRFAALALTINMAVAFFIAHSAKFVGTPPGEPAFIYLIGFAALLLAGPGRFSADRG